jgi:GNAT superfamily N-acetyltransferase
VSQYNIEYPGADDFAWTFFVNDGDRRVGRAHLHNVDGNVKLCDILIYDEIYNSSFLSKVLNYLKKKKNYRSKGAGSFLLKECVAFCRANNAKRIWGKAQSSTGEEKRLWKWYKSFGFKVLSDGAIELDLEFGG